MELSILDYNKQPLKIDKPIRLIELFAGIGSQAKALERLGADFEHYRVCEFDKYAIKSYNVIHGTDFETSDITKITATDLGIVDTDKYCYIMTYSFPCQDLSLAGKGKGMAKGDNTRSGLLWEVERLLNECEELPQVLLMENVTQVHGKKNKEHFDEWIDFLESKGYSNYWKDLNAKNFGIPQNRNRTFMVSVLGRYKYEFPEEFPLELRLKDMLEDNVDEKYYLSDVALNRLQTTTFSQGKFENRVMQEDGISKTLCARDYKDPTCVQIGNLQGGKWDKMHDISRRVYSGDGICPTLHTCGGGNTEPKVIGGIGEKKSNGGTQWYQQDHIYDNNVAISVTTAFNPYYKVDEPFICASRGRNPENPSDRTAGITLRQRLEPNFSGCTNTLTTVQKDNYVAEPQINVVGNYSPSGHDASRIVDVGGIAPTVKENHGTVTAVAESCYVSEKGIKYIFDSKRKIATDANADEKVIEDCGVINPLKDKTPYGWHFEQQVYDVNGITRAVKAGGGSGNIPKAIMTEPQIIREEPLEREGWHNYAKEVLSSEGLCRTLSTQSNNLATKIKEPCNLRIRKLTPKECWRLMGFDDADFEKAQQVNSNSQLYKQAGNSIVVDVLCHIFSQML